MDTRIITPPMTHGMLKRPNICRSVLCGYPVWWILYPKKNSSSHAPVFQTKNNPPANKSKPIQNTTIIPPRSIFRGDGSLGSGVANFHLSLCSSYASPSAKGVFTSIVIYHYQQGLQPWKNILHEFSSGTNSIVILYHKPYSRREKTSQAKRNETTSSAAANGYGGTSKQDFRVYVKM
jgi:hypothetical protein